MVVQINLRIKVSGVITLIVEHIISTFNKWTYSFIILLLNQKLNTMYWEEWLRHHAPETWSLEDHVKFIQTDCPNVTVEEIELVLIARHEIRNSNIGKALRGYY